MHTIRKSNQKKNPFSLSSVLFLGEKEAEEEEEKEEGMCGDCECRPLGWLLGLPFAFLALLVSIIGVIIWIVGLSLSCICPCCLCVTVLVELAIELIKAPLHVMQWFTSKIPC